MADHLSDPTTERALVEALLFDPDALARVAGLEADHFADPVHAALYRALVACWTAGHGVELAQIAAELRRARALDAVGGWPALRELVERGYTSAYAEVHAARVRDLARCREAETTLRRALARLAAPELAPADALADAAALASTVAVGASSQSYGLAAHIDRAWAEHEERAAGRLINARWGVASLDHELSLGGLIAGGLYVLAADTGSGKTTLAMQAAVATATTGRRVVIYSQEMPGAELAWRLAGARAGMSVAQIRTGHLADGQVEALGRAAGELARLPIEIRDSGDATPDRIRAEVLAEASRGGLGLVVVDYLQILAVDADQRRAGLPEQLGYATRALKRAAVRAKVPVLLLSQFNRGRDLKAAPTLSDLKGSGSIEQDADAVVLLHHTPEHTQAIVAKHRHGPKGDPARLTWDAAHGLFRDDDPPPPVQEARWSSDDNDSNDDWEAA
mgnify:FL=1